MTNKHLPALQNKIDEATAMSTSSEDAASWARTGQAVLLGACQGVVAVGVGLPYGAPLLAAAGAALGPFVASAVLLLGGALVGADIAVRQLDACTRTKAQQAAANRANQLRQVAVQQADEHHNLRVAAQEVASLQALLAVLDPTGPHHSPESPGPAQVATKLGVLVIDLVCLVQQTHVSLVEHITRVPGSSSSSTAVDQQEVVSELGDLLTEVHIADSRWRTDIGGMAAGLAATAGVEAEGLLRTFLKSSQIYLTSKLSITAATAGLLLEDVKATCPVDGVMALLHRTCPNTAAQATSLPSSSGSPQQGAGSTAAGVCSASSVLA